MPKEIRAIWDWLKTPEMSPGKITLVTVLSGAIVTVMTFGAYFQLGFLSVNAATSTVATTVTVLNVPPVWTVNAQEGTESSTSTPTQAGYTFQWTGTGTDSNGDQYYLLICYGTSTTAVPTPGVDGPPTCGSGALQWAISGATNSGSQATAATSTAGNVNNYNFPFNSESNDWYAWVCDKVATNPSCNSTYTRGSGTTVSPFVVNHAPFFSVITNDSPAAPGESVTWTSVATDTDVIRGGDLVGLWVCKTASFATSTCSGGASNTWASSTLTTFNPATTTDIVIPTQDQTYAAYVYIQDNAGRQATSTLQGSNSSFVITNATPTVSLITFSSTSSSDIVLFRPYATSGPYQVQFSVTDNNSCLNASSGNEIAFATTSVYRSAMTSCTASTTMNSNMCYPSMDSQTQIVCTQDGGSCSGATDSVSTWTCTVPLWYNADPTDVGSVYAAQNWLATVQVRDDNYATSTTATSAGTELNQFLAFDVSTTSIAYGGLQPGQENTTLVQSTDLVAWGNTGIDEMLYGDTMCTSWSSFGSCDLGGPVASSSMIASWNQRLATTSVAFNDSTTYSLHASSSPLIIALGVPKTTSTSSPQSKNTYWGIHIPIEITTSGAYTGQNVIGAIVSNTAYW